MDPVQAQVDAYNARDIDAFVAPYADDVVITDAGGRPIMAGVATIREEYGAMFAASPTSRPRSWAASPRATGRSTTSACRAPARPVRCWSPTRSPTGRSPAC